MVKVIPGIWKTVFKNWRYQIIAIVFAVLFYSFNVLVASLKTLRDFYSSQGVFQTTKFFMELFFGFKETIKFHSYISLVIISILLGILFSLIAFKINLGKETDTKKIGFFASIGVFLAALAPGCAVCGIGLLSVLGISSGFLLFLPFEGLELSILSITILIYAIRKITQEMYMCKTSFKIKK